MEVNIFLAFFFGILSFFSPCVLPLVPGYLTIFSGTENTTQNRLRGSLEFCLGFSIVFISLAAIASSVGSFFTRNSSSLGMVSGLIIIFFGTLLLFPTVNMKYFYSANYVDLKKFSTFKNFVLGLTFAFGFTPCIGPVLGALLTLTSNSDTLNRGIGLLVSFSIGLTIPFILISVLAGKFNMKSKLFITFQKYSSKISGLVLITLGILIFTDKMYILASLFQDLLIFINLDWLSTI
ncbi:cytochrome c biogenesis protein CcdA [Acidimicrobiia bacterium]|jgi:cytochrome c-type biogenesis protein|nr:cytochrome c biogenesis protein CcdA [Acidimicrobiia bacterium]MDA9645739.1 cytochrome c biogenesis protein CcdA [Candidatus Actinomarina sp.]MDC1071144.1 cytochrome c biogenesis protein CcdA [Acidimicrobiia bacterium]|tara:strand:+ start:403 stop:1110 length:708 start_codon:yes stop_codon:yes gene_type:complete